LVSARRTCNNVAHQLDIPAALNTGFVVVGIYGVPAAGVVLMVLMVLVVLMVLMVLVVFRSRADSKAAAAILCQKYRETWTGVNQFDIYHAWD
jgi:Na+-transporting methylmalonyl-CoA/oxaloacetate decarboxylase gamma subunit